MNPRALARLAAGIAVAAVVACSSSNPAPPVPVEGAKKSDLKALAGKWSGEYTSVDTGRSGSIVFEFKEGGTEGYGDVLMWPVGSKAPNQSAEQAVQTMPQVLEINTVRTEGGYVTGAMSTYVDPGCNCEVRTTFSGSIDGDIIIGEFTTERWDKQGKPTKGKWKVTREKKA